jgi:hypothetical protein
VSKLEELELMVRSAEETVKAAIIKGEADGELLRWWLKVREDLRWYRSKAERQERVNA